MLSILCILYITGGIAFIVLAMRTLVVLYRENRHPDCQSITTDGQTALTIGILTIVVHLCIYGFYLTFCIKIVKWIGNQLASSDSTTSLSLTVVS